MQAAAEAARNSRAGDSGPAVLVVEDEAIVARDLERSLADMGYDVLGVAATCEEALCASEERTPDVVLMDIHIAGQTDGIDAAALLRQRFHVPVIFLTAYADNQTVARAAQTAPYGYLVKPFTSVEVRSAIEVARRKHELDQQVARRERWFSTTLSSIGDAVVACDAERRIAFMNPAAEALTGWSREEAVGEQVDTVVDVQNAGSETLAHVVDRALRTRGVERIPPGSRLVRRASERSLLVDDCASAIVHEGSVLGAVVVLRDVTEQHDLRQRAMASERLATLGTLSVGIAHEINNPLTFVLGNAHSLERLITTLGQDGTPERTSATLAAAKTVIATLVDGAERIQRIVADMGSFGSRAATPSTLMDVRVPVEWALRVTAHQIRHRATVLTDLGVVPPVLANESQVGQVVVNLLSNAAHAFSADDGAGQLVRVATKTDEHGWAVISVHDNGVGMTPEVLTRAFDPFFTTKEAGKGTGLGLSICRRIVDVLGGQIRVESAPNEGTSVDVRLPPGALHSRQALPPPAAVEALRGRVLIIDDEPNVLRSLSDLLSAEHDVVTTAGAEEGLAHLERDRDFDLVLCDAHMPRVDGPHLLRDVEQRWPDLVPTIVFMTGGELTPEAAELLRQLGVAHIQKPFEPGTVLQLISDRLQRRGGERLGGPVRRFEHVLIVDQDPILLRVLESIAIGWGSRVKTAKTLEEALEVARPPLDLLVADGRLAEGPGRKLLRRVLRFQPKPMVVATRSEAGAEEGFDLSVLGADGLLQKPFTVTDFERCIERAAASRSVEATGPSLRAEIGRFAQRYGLNARQRRMVELVVGGATSRELPRLLGISENSCKRAVRRLLARCGATRLTDITRRMVVEHARP